MRLGTHFLSYSAMARYQVDCYADRHESFDYFGLPAHAHRSLEQVQSRTRFRGYRHIDEACCSRGARTAANDFLAGHDAPLKSWSNSTGAEQGTYGDRAAIPAASTTLGR